MAIKFIDDTRIYELYQKGMFHREIANVLGCDVSTVTRHLIDMGIKSDRVDKIKMRHLHEQGLSDAEIADILGCTRSNVTVAIVTGKQIGRAHV